MDTSIKKERNGEVIMKEVSIKIPSGALGDNIAWFPYFEVFRKKHKVKVNALVAHYKLFEDTYPKINFLKPGTKLYNHVQLYPDYQTGIDFDKGEYINWPLQKVASKALGLRYREIKPKLNIPDEPSRIVGKYVTISTQASMQCKYWNNLTGWDEVIKFLKSEGYNVVCIDQYRYYGDEEVNFMNPIPTGVIDKTGGIDGEHFDLQDRMVDIKYADFHIGLPAGLSWLSWAAGTHVIMISGFSNSTSEFKKGVTRVEPTEKDICKWCWNSPKSNFQSSDWWWCPEHKATDRQFECSRSITGQQVINTIKKHIKNMYIQ